MFFLFFFNDTATTEIYTLSLHDALPISKENLAIVSSKPKLQSAVNSAGLHVGLPDFSPGGGIEPEQPAVLVAADHDVAPFAAAEGDVPDELGLLAESHVRPDGSLAAIGGIRDRHRKERGNHGRPAVQVRRAARVIPGVVLVSVVNPVDAPRIHVDREHRIRVDLQLLVEVVAAHARRQAWDVRVRIAAPSPGKLAVL